jgi:hypothetical protein
MKGKRAHKSTGGVDDADEDVKDKTPDRSAPNNIAKEAEEKKRGGRAKKAHGGKMIGKVGGEKAAKHAGRKPRKSGGRTGSENNPLTSSHSGTTPAGRSVMPESMD